MPILIDNKSFSRTYASSADPDLTPQNVESDRGLHCLVTEFSIIIGTKMENQKHPVNGNEQAQLMIVGHSIRLKWVNGKKYNHGLF